MDLIFKVGSSIAENKANVNDTDFRQYYGQLNTNNSWSLLKPFIKQATLRKIIPFVSAEWYNDLASAYMNGVTLTDSQTQALDLLKYVAAYYTAELMYVENIDISTDAGNFQNSPNQAVTTPLAYFKIKLYNLTKTADEHIDRLLAFMDSRVGVSDAKFTLYANSTAFENGKAELFRTTEEFQVYHNVLNSRRTFIAILPYIRDAVVQFARPLITSDLYEQIVQQYNTSTLTVANQKVFFRLRAMVAKYAIANAAKMNTLIIEGDGFRVASNTDGFDTRESAVHTRRNEIESMRYDVENMAKMHQADLINFLKSNSADYPSFAAMIINIPETQKIVAPSDCYGNTLPGGIALF